MRIIDAEDYLYRERPVGLSDELYEESHLYKSIMEQEVVQAIPLAKVDKAIEEMENEVKFWDCPVNYQEPLEVQRNKQAKANSYRHALEILKRNIGE